VKCRAVVDQAEGWVTLKGNQGTAFLESASKPYLWLVEGVAALHKACERSSDEVGSLEAGEVMEVLEGPRKEAPLELFRIRGKAKSDGKTGWATLKAGKDGRPNFECARTMLCKSSIALTTAFDVAACAPIRKLEAGEVLEQVEPPKEDETRKLTRVHVKCTADGKEGWATMKGNAGTAYIVENLSHQICRIGVPLESNHAAGSKVLRPLEPGEVFEVLEGPTAEVKPGDLRAKGRTLRGSREGWFTVSDAVKPWSPSYVCAKPTDLADGPDAGAAVIRRLEAEERVEALDGPAAGPDGALRLRLRAPRDGAVGFAAARAAGPAGEVFLRPADGGGG